MANITDGWFLLSRKEDDLYFDEKFTRWQAWQDLIRLACFKPYKSHIRGVLIEHEIGCVYESQDNLARRWQWSKGKVVRFLKELESDGRIELQKSNVINCISVVNYAKYQQNGTTNDTTDCTTNGTTNRTTNGSTHKEDIKKDKEDIKNILESSSLTQDKPPKRKVEVFEKPSVEEVKAYAISKGYSNFDAEHFWNYYESNGWRVGKSPMKSWKSAVVTWTKRDNQIINNQQTNYNNGRAKNQPISEQDIRTAVAVGINLAETKKLLEEDKLRY